MNTFSDGATVISVDPQGSVDKLYARESVEFRCHAEANPLPSYTWVRHTPGGSVILSHERTLRLAEAVTRLLLRLGVEAEQPRRDTGAFTLGLHLTSLLASLVWPQTCGDFKY